MTNDTDRQQSAVMKILASMGLLAVLIFLVWVAVQLVQYAPSAFQSLASLADSVYNRQSVDQFAITVDEKVVNAGSSFVVSWPDLGTDVNYTFQYSCTDGVALDIRTATGEIAPLSCDTSLSLGSRTELHVLTNSERNRFTDVRYTVTAFRVNDGENLASVEDKVTIVNATIPQSTQVADVTPTEPKTDSEPEVPVVTTPSTPTAPRPTAPVVIEEQILAIPVSDPKGFTDLAVRAIGVGIIDAQGRFVPQQLLDNDTKGALQFEVKNSGTKTSSEWNVSAILPSGVAYNSKEQLPLKPNERTIITLTFTLGQSAGIKTFSATATGGGDVLLANNSFASSVPVID